jgi:hypothetical protein
MTNYEKITNELGTELIKRTDADGQVWSIPLDPANSDYQAYLATLAANSAPTA